MLEDRDIEKLKEAFLTKEAFLEIGATKEDLEKYATKDDIIEFKNEILTGYDTILEKLNTISQEKTFGDAQDMRQKKVLEIHNTALKNNKILSEKEALEIDGLRVF